MQNDATSSGKASKKRQRRLRQQTEKSEALKVKADGAPANPPPNDDAKLLFTVENLQVESRTCSERRRLAARFYSKTRREVLSPEAAFEMHLNLQLIDSHDIENALQAEQRFASIPAFRFSDVHAPKLRLTRLPGRSVCRGILTWAEKLDTYSNPWVLTGDQDLLEDSTFPIALFVILRSFPFHKDLSAVGKIYTAELLNAGIVAKLQEHIGKTKAACLLPRWIEQLPEILTIIETDSDNRAMLFEALVGLTLMRVKLHTFLLPLRAMQFKLIRHLGPEHTEKGVMAAEIRAKPTDFSASYFDATQELQKVLHVVLRLTSDLAESSLLQYEQEIIDFLTKPDTARGPIDPFTGLGWPLHSISHAINNASSLCEEYVVRAILYLSHLSVYHAGTKDSYLNRPYRFRHDNKLYTLDQVMPTPANGTSLIDKQTILNNYVGLLVSWCDGLQMLQIPQQISTFDGLSAHLKESDLFKLDWEQLDDMLRYYGSCGHGKLQPRWRNAAVRIEDVLPATKKRALSVGSDESDRSDGHDAKRTARRDSETLKPTIESDVDTDATAPGAAESMRVASSDTVVSVEHLSDDLGSSSDDCLSDCTSNVEMDMPPASEDDDEDGDEDEDSELESEFGSQDISHAHAADTVTEDAVRFSPSQRNPNSLVVDSRASSTTVLGKPVGGLGRNSFYPPTDDDFSGSSAGSN